MQKLLNGLWLCLVFFTACKASRPEQAPPDILSALEIMCSTIGLIPDETGVYPIDTLSALPKIDHPRLVYVNDPSEYPRVVANENTMPAGRFDGDTCEIHLEIMWSDFYPETEDRPGLRLITIAEKGKAPTIPAPMIRIREGTVLRVSIHNTLSDSTVTMFGLQTRPSEIADSVDILQGETQTITFVAGDAGTYLYWARLGNHKAFAFGEEEDQLSGAFIIDPEKGSLPDRVLVMNIFSDLIDTQLHPYGFLEILTINGKSWPFTELFYYDVGDTVRWRVINGSQRFHPMHLHGFYYHILSRGGVLEDRTYAGDHRPLVVTETMKDHKTMNIEWIATRPGRWLFHCHLSFHISEDLRLPGASVRDPAGHKGHMAGLVTGMVIRPGPSDLIYKGEPREITLFANEYEGQTWDKCGFSENERTISNATSQNSPGPCLVLKQYQPTYITVQNQLSVPTSIHWHGLEIESWSDGVAGWSASDDKHSPEIEPGGTFTYKLSLMRPGTFIYHSHFNDVAQLSSGLYGALIVMGENEVYHPETDHSYIYGWRNVNPKSVSEIELNGLTDQPDMQARADEEHRLRLMNIAPAALVTLSIMKAGVPVEFTFIAKDGADLPEVQRIQLTKTQDLGVGETADFMFTPVVPGTYTLEVSEKMIGHTWKQKWVVL